MDIIAKSLKDIFHDRDYAKENSSYSAYIFPLITSGDEEVLNSFLSSSLDAHYATADNVLIFAPSIRRHDLKSFSVEELVSLRTRSEPWITDKYLGFLNRQTEETYELCAHIGLPMDELPCLVVFDTIEEPTQFSSVSLTSRVCEGTSIGAVVREVVSVMEDRCNWRTRRNVRELEKELNAEIPFSVIESSSAFKAVKENEGELAGIEKQIGTGEFSISQKAYQNAIGRLSERLLNHPNGPVGNKKTPDYISLLEQGKYSEPALNHLRSLKKSGKSKLDQEILGLFDSYFDVCDDFLRAALLLGNLKTLDEEVLRERENISSRLQTLNEKLGEPTPIPSEAILSLNGAKKWKVTGSNSAIWNTFEVKHLEGTSVKMGTQEFSREKSILFLAANPRETGQLRLDQEVREVDEGLRRSRRRDQFTLSQRWAVRPSDLRRSLLDLEPSVLHFSGHGAGPDGIILENADGYPHYVSTDAVSELFALFTSRRKCLECVVMNACFSLEQAEAIASHVPYVVGMYNAIGDDAAIEFSVGFYDALGAGSSYEEAFQFGSNAIRLMNISEEAKPHLLANVGT